MIWIPELAAIPSSVYRDAGARSEGFDSIDEGLSEDRLHCSTDSVHLLMSEAALCSEQSMEDVKLVLGARSGGGEQGDSFVKLRAARQHSSTN